MNRHIPLFLVGLMAVACPALAQKDSPSREPVKGCVWEKISDAKLGLEAWVQRCDFGFRKIDFLTVKDSLAIRYSDGGAPDPLIDVLVLIPGERPEPGIKRLFQERTDKTLASRCVLAPHHGDKLPAGVKRYTFVPDAAYQKELDAKANPDEVPEPPCGDWGDAPDGVQYFEAQPTRVSNKILFVRVGQDEPLFDEKTLRLLPSQ